MKCKLLRYCISFLFFFLEYQRTDHFEINLHSNWAPNFRIWISLIKEGTIIKSHQFVLYEITLNSYNFLWYKQTVALHTNNSPLATPCRYQHYRYSRPHLQQETDTLAKSEAPCLSKRVDKRKSQSPKDNRHRHGDSKKRKAVMLYVMTYTFVTFLAAKII